MTADGWAQGVRHRLGLGRLLPLGGPGDGAWITEEAAEAVLRRAVGELGPLLRLDALRIALADPEDAPGPAVPPPPGAVPPGPLRVTAEFAATAAQPLPVTAALLRTTLAATATERIGLAVDEVDLRVTALLDEDPDPLEVRPPEPPPAAEPADGDEARAASAALLVPGVARLTRGLGRPVHIEEREQDGALPHRHARVEIAVLADHRPVEVAREVRAVVAGTLPGHPTVAVVVTGAC
ncbi:nucleopolyhedrovirus P10 family protein [Streptomyces sp. NPDC005648]|uniref:nucleopolyhedrovirus P10 family protein n=1 Tax=Streptomyces sp. NPDC005648 TaxID=3157044 RepID=UPI0033BE8E69